MTREQMAWILALLSILGTLFMAGSQWGELRTRLTAAEEDIKDIRAEQHYLHGDVEIPHKGVK